MYEPAIPKNIADKCDKIIDANGNKIELKPASPSFFEIQCGRGEWTAKTLEDAKEMAKDFADGVS